MCAIASARDDAGGVSAHKGASAHSTQAGQADLQATLSDRFNARPSPCPRLFFEHVLHPRASPARLARIHPIIPAHARSGSASCGRRRLSRHHRRRKRRSRSSAFTRPAGSTTRHHRPATSAASAQEARRLASGKAGHHDSPVRSDSRSSLSCFGSKTARRN